MFVTDASVCLPQLSDMSGDVPKLASFEYSAPRRPCTGTLIASISSKYSHDVGMAHSFPGMEIARLAAAAAVAYVLTYLPTCLYTYITDVLVMTVSIHHVPLVISLQDETEGD